MLITIKDVTLDKLSEIAQRLAAQLEPGMCVCLWGDLGAGKSTLSRMIIRSLNPEITDVPSPTFTLMQQYNTPCGVVWHCDLYRLNYPDEIIEIGLEDAIHDAITLIEWPEKMGMHLPANRLDIRMTINVLSQETRTMSFQCEGDVEVDLRLEG